MNAEDIHDFMILWMDEVFDSLPSGNDKDDYTVAESIWTLQRKLEQGDFAFFEEICRKSEAVRKALRFQEAEVEPDSSSEEKMENPETTNFDKQAQFEKDFEKAKNKVNIEIEKDLLPRFNADDDEDWQQA